MVDTEAGAAGPGPTGPPPITAVLFDFHQTLVHSGDAAAWLAAGWTACGRGADPLTGLGSGPASAAAAFLDRVWEHAQEIDPDSSRDESPERHRSVFLATAARCPSLDADLAEALYEAMPRRWEAYADTVPVLTALRQRGVRTAVVSNVGFDLRPIIERSGMDVDAVVLSYEVGSVKPDAGIFTRALELLGAAPQEALMVGDSWRDDSGAAALGIRTLLLPRTSGTVHGLESVLRLVGSSQGR
ncbi:HAD family hydrolase [Ornithinimicrobium murale]|uniref:HAD family hydrolase n=1 Tax=Ornithinimicrobium murale TaxID=1050153 RepID=UPI000E0D8948|nr:HAD-IA family hydrolase [Ornithinimicrobium murale]